MNTEEKREIIHRWVRQFSILNGVQEIESMWGRILFSRACQFGGIPVGGYQYTPKCHSTNEVIETSYDMIKEWVWVFINEH